MTTKKITIICPPSIANKVSVIKAIRVLTGMGLKEAKDASEVVGRPQEFDLNPSIWTKEAEIEELCNLLRREGIQVGEPVYKLLEDLRKLGSQALLQGEDELANEILQLVLAEKLRRKP